MRSESKQFSLEQLQSNISVKKIRKSESVCSCCGVCPAQ